MVPSYRRNAVAAVTLIFALLTSSIQKTEADLDLLCIIGCAIACWEVPAFPVCYEACVIPCLAVAGTPRDRNVVQCISADSRIACKDFKKDSPELRSCLDKIAADCNKKGSLSTNAPQLTAFSASNEQHQPGEQEHMIQPGLQQFADPGNK